MSKVVVITGASSGIGQATAELLAKLGDSVVLVARGPGPLQDAASRCGPNALAVPADMTRRDNVRRVVAAAVARFKHVDVWVNNVGQGIWRAPSELTDEDVDTMMRMNVKTTLYGTQEILTHFRQRGGGHVINVSSMLGRLPLAPNRTAYTAAKHYINALTAGFRDELRATHPGIAFSLVSPPVVYTNFGSNALYGGPDSRSLPEGQEPEEVASVIRDVIDTRAPDVYTRSGSHQRVTSYFDSIGTDP